MTLNNITINFESLDEMKRFRDECSLRIFEEDENDLWITYDIAGLEPYELCEAIDLIF